MTVPGRGLAASVPPGPAAPRREIRIAVLVSGRGRGTNLQAILDGCASGEIPGSVTLVVSTTPDTPAMDRARRAGVETVHMAGGQNLVPDATTGPPGSLDAALLRLLQERRIDLVCLAGFMRKVGPEVLAAFAGRIMNIHPSLIPAFAGVGMYGARVHQAVLDYGAKVSGCTVQLVEEEYDAGPIILQRVVPVLEDDSASTLAARVLEQEHIAYVEAIRLFAEGRLLVEGRRVRVLPERSLRQGSDGKGSQG